MSRLCRFSASDAGSWDSDNEESDNQDHLWLQLVEEDRIYKRFLDRSNPLAPTEEIDESDCERDRDDQKVLEQNDLLPWPDPRPEAVLPPAESMPLVTEGTDCVTAAAAALPGKHNGRHLTAESIGQEVSVTTSPVMELNVKYEQRVSGLRRSIDELEHSMEEAFSPHQHAASDNSAVRSSSQEREALADLKMLPSCQQRLQRSASEAARMVEEVEELEALLVGVRLEVLRTTAYLPALVFTFCANSTRA